MSEAAAIIILQLVLKYGPEIGLAIATIFAKQTFTIEEWTALFAQIRSYDQIMADAVKRATPPAV